jgi:tetratricopeptide (TPR) repeat protein
MVAAALWCSLLVTPEALPQNPDSAAATRPLDQALTRAKELEARAYETKQKEDFEAAAVALEDVLRLDPDHLQTRKSLGYLYLERLNSPAKAYPHLRVVVRSAPHEGWEQMLAKTALATGQTQVAVATYRSIIAHDPANVWDRLALAKLLVKLDRHGEAAELYQQALKIEPDNEYVNVDYAEFLMSRGDRAAARSIAERTLQQHPRSAGAHSILGELERTDWNFARAEQHYAEALKSDPHYYTAVEGRRLMARSRSPVLNSTFYQFEDTDGLEQAGIFNTLTLSLTDHLYLDTSFNALWFSNDDLDVGTINRFEEGLALEYRFSKKWSARAGVSAFQTEGADDEVGFNVGATWVPNPAFYAYGFYRENDPVNDSIFTVQQSFTQDILAGGAGFQFWNRWSLSGVASTADYSDGNERRYFKGALSYMLLKDPLAYLRLEYELFDYERRDARYSSPQWYDYVRPVFEIEPQFTSWLSAQFRLEVPYVVDEADWGTGLVVGPVIKLGSDFEFRGTYIRYDLPGEVAAYSGDGFKISMIWRF